MLSKVMLVTVSVEGPAAVSLVPTCCHSPGGNTTSRVTAPAVTTGATRRSSPTRNSVGGDIRRWNYDVLHCVTVFSSSNIVREQE